MSNPINDPESSVGFLLQDVTRLLRRNFNRRVQALGLTQSQWQAIARLWRNEGISQSALADILEITPITLTRLLDRMQAAGWVERRPDPNDRRAVRLYLTDKIQPILAQMWEIAAETREQALRGLSAEQRQLLIEALQKMKGNLCAEELDCGAESVAARKRRGSGASGPAVTKAD